MLSLTMAALALLSAYKQHRVLDKWLTPYLGRLRLRDVSREALDTYRAQLRSAGAGAPTVNRTLGILQGVMQRAVEWRRIAANPVAGVPRLTHVRDEDIDARTPEQVELIRSRLDRENAALVSVLAYEALRPGLSAIRRATLRVVWN